MATNPPQPDQGEQIDKVLNTFFCPKCGGSLAEREVLLSPSVSILEGALKTMENGKTTYAQKYACANGHVYAAKSSWKINRGEAKAALLRLLQDREKAARKDELQRFSDWYYFDRLEGRQLPIENYKDERLAQQEK